MAGKSEQGQILVEVLLTVAFILMFITLASHVFIEAKEKSRSYRFSHSRFKR